MIEVEHVREGVDLHVRETGIQIAMEVRNRDHAERVLDARPRRSATSSASPVPADADRQEAPPSAPTAPASCAPGLRSGGGRDEDGLELAVGGQGVHGQLAAEAALLEPAEGGGEADRRVGVDREGAQPRGLGPPAAPGCRRRSRSSPRARRPSRWRGRRPRPRRRTAPRRPRARRPPRGTAPAHGSPGATIVHGNQKPGPLGAAPRYATSTPSTSTTATRRRAGHEKR